MKIFLDPPLRPTLAPFAALHSTNFGNSAGPLLSKCVVTGETPFMLANGEDYYTKLSTDPRFSAVFNEAMTCTTEVTMEALWGAYGDRFAQLRSITDVGGGIGAALREIVTRFPNIRGVNFDMPHVVAEAPECDGVTHVGGDMFVDDIPPADAVFMKVNGDNLIVSFTQMSWHLKTKELSFQM